MVAARRELAAHGVRADPDRRRRVAPAERRHPTRRLGRHRVPRRAARRSADHHDARGVDGLVARLGVVPLAAPRDGLGRLRVDRGARAARVHAPLRPRRRRGDRASGRDRRSGPTRAAPDVAVDLGDRGPPVPPGALDRLRARARRRARHGGAPRRDDRRAARLLPLRRAARYRGRRHRRVGRRARRDGRRARVRALGDARSAARRAACRRPAATRALRRLLLAARADAAVDARDATDRRVVLVAHARLGCARWRSGRS